MIRIDNTQYSAYTKCPYLWFEKYVNKVHRPVEGERNDALAIGVAVHAALENGYQSGEFLVPRETFEEMPLTREAHLEVKSMVEAYRAAYPGGPVEFEWVGLEDPLEYTKYEYITLVAKVDGYFIVDSPIEADDGNGSSIHLEPGLYGFETKTKMASLNRGAYLQEWQAAMQASFQLITLQEYALSIGLQKENVRGILVNVIERPKVYTPRKTCNECKELMPVYTYKIEGVNYICGRCGHHNKFKASQIPEPRVDPPSLWRFVVERSEERLQYDLASILECADYMYNMILAHKHWTNIMAHAPAPANRNQCVDAYRNWRCEYFEPHNAYIPVHAIDWPGFVTFNPTAYLEKKEN